MLVYFGEKTNASSRHALSDKTASSSPVRRVLVYWKSVKNGQTKPTCAIDKNILVSTHQVFRPSALSIHFTRRSGKAQFQRELQLPKTFTTELGARFTSTDYRRKEVEINMEVLLYVSINAFIM